jgi:hypothetical protein
VDIIQVDLNTSEEYFDISPLLTETIEVIPLETTDESLIGEITDVRVEDDRIFITDEMSHRITVFDREGKYVSKIDRYGRGPGEYLEIAATEVLNDSTCVILDLFNMSLLYYRIDGRFIKTKDVSEIWARAVVKTDDKLYFVNSGSSSKKGFYHLFSVSENSDKIEAFLPFDGDKMYNNSIGWSLDRYYSKNDDELLLYFPPYDTLYTVSNNRAQAICFVDFGSRKLPKNILEGDGRTALITSIEKGYISGVEKVLATDKYLFIDFREKEEYTAIYNRATKEIQVSRFVINSDLGGFRLFGNKAIVRDGILISSLNASEINVHLGESSGFPNKEFPAPNIEFMDKIDAIRKTDPSDNPVLFIQKFK